MRKSDRLFDEKLKAVQLVYEPHNYKIILFGQRKVATEINQFIKQFIDELEKSITYRTFTVSEK